MPLIPAQSAAALERSIAQWADRIAEKTLDDLMGELFGGLRRIVEPKVLADGHPDSTAGAVTGRIYELLKPYENATDLAGALNLEFKLDVAQRVARGAGRFVSDQADVDEYPAWELHRIYERDVPRGFRTGAGGALIPVPDDEWPVRWEKAAEASGDNEAARVLRETGRMVALKSSGIWQQLGDGAGGYDDTLGNPFAPFAFNSGYGTDGVPRLECIELGLLRTDEKPQPSSYDPNNLISLPA